MEAGTGKGIANIRNTIRHETSHLEQYGLENGDYGDRPLVNYNGIEKKIPFYKQATKALAEFGYNPKHTDTMIKEILSTASERAYDAETGKNRLGLTQDQMRQMTKAIVDESVALHGIKGYNLMQHASKDFRKAVVLGHRIPTPRELAGAAVGSAAGSP